MPTAIELAKQFQASLVGEASLALNGLAPLERAQSDQISFLSNPLYRQQASDSAAGALIVSQADLDFLQANPSAYSARRVYFVSKNPYATFARMAQHFAQSTMPQYQSGVHPSASIDPSASIPASCHIGAFVQIGAGVKLGERVAILGNTTIASDSIIGNDSVIHPSASIYYGTQIGERCIIHSGAVIGADGFGFAPDFSASGGEWVKIPQTGRVVIGNDVEVGASTTIDRGAMSDTVIGAGSKIDNQVQIAHNVSVGSCCVIAGCAAISGSTKIGNFCIIGGAANFAGHLTIADRTTVSGNTSIIRSITEPGQHFTGVYPSMLHSAWEKNAAILRGLDKIRQRLRLLDKNQNRES
ncbi:UDP-3-O-(3-hydroxymyristoyl)glucosamine N-acyltransferase [Polynucleobacter sp. AP-Latsch-80-C2]|jgi:UDP-3-O-[3-hydroxymyristoyl] glucosamine N-acyltransferase|uniref:UDP-3-O-(3-hydroxymyristoyl)glucosamine N-acyltransferase n=1 Tax=Polynucleobacter sp. AP-Latsch-80-C2 TaxID=2576931 RepID=UPI001C0DFD36|nr:UDP-3-O-(3-hydroxymyristoyl)glucosamine N-acyltransferase [Polynucleobacter sp. AP-Latsch-80-C2]MBU3623589.1 UDP-3-O-(3-hydroxymyristoyl)glucosamine N-acyltransferase [Polynucleobacter sp. AP-Latsch-80-C2]